MTDLDQLLSEFATRFESGEGPDPAAFIARAAAGERAELASRIDAYLDTAPTQKWDPDSYARSAARVAAERVFESLEGDAGSWPELLPRLRNRARIQREELTRRLAQRLGFEDGSQLQRVHSYYHQMEHGQISAPGVSDRVLEALAELLGTSARSLRVAGERVSGADAGGRVSFARHARPAPEYSQGSILSESEQPAGPPPPGFAGAAETGAGAGQRSQPELDELDQLFLGRRR